MSEGVIERGERREEKDGVGCTEHRADKKGYECMQKGREKLRDRLTTILEAFCNNEKKRNGMVVER